MERKFPKNVRQVGNVCDTPKIYVEDYVDTYLNQLKDRAQEQPVGAFLIGEKQTIEEQECVCITGAVKMSDLDSESADIKIDEEVLKAAQEERKEYFETGEIVGWFLIQPGKPLGLTSDIMKIHEEFFAQDNSILILKDPAENEELYFSYKYHELMQMGGHYIFYEKNPSMQNYMINTRKQNGVTPSEMVEDRAAKDFRSTIREKMEAQEQKSNSRLVYVTSALLVVVVLAIGISTLNNYDKMNSVQTSIETLSKSVLNDDSGPKKEETDTDTQTPADVPAEEGTEQTVEPETQNSPQETEPVTSTIQEELSDSDYYIVQKGDTLDKISLKIYGTTSETDAICSMNGLADGNLIFIGQKLLLP